MSADPSALLSSWKTGSNPCGGAPWQGITCSGGWVAGLQLAGAQLRGTLSPALGWMSQLREIHLQGNAFSGGSLCVGAWVQHNVLTCYVCMSAA